MKLFEAPKVNIKSNLLIDRFVVPPLTTLNTQQGYWQMRKRHWISLGIKSELGRDGDLLGGNLQGIKGRGGRLAAGNLPSTSIFDPVLCECLYTWFSREGDTIFDPFAGGSVRGIVAGALQRNYTGIDLRQEQIDANNANYDAISEHFTGIIKPNWITGNSLNCKQLVGDKKFDMLMTCPPYYDLEVYSDKPDDLSNLDSYEEFLEMYKGVFKASYDLMDDDTFAAVVVSEIRDKAGNYRGFVADTIKIMQEIGFNYYNEAILLGAYTTVTLRVPAQFNAGRKMGRCHQNVLVFYKGNNKNIKNKFGEVDVDCNEQFMD